MNIKKSEIIVRALHTLQGEGLDVFAFFIKGSQIYEMADISRIQRDENEALQGFQRPEIKAHVKSIIEYLDQKNVIFPNAVILAISPEVKFVPSRGPRPDGLSEIAQSGTLTIPIYKEGERVAWIVDGQQRSLALSETKNSNIPIPVIAFVSDSLEIQREQFILVNKAKPLPSRLINELLPETRGITLPRELNSRKIPSELCDLLNRDPQSPFYQLIKRPSDSKSTKSKAVITDTAVINMIRSSLSNTLGALAPYKGAGKDNPDLASMYQLLLLYWGVVREIFPDAWGKEPRHSRLMHSAGIEAMGVLMDRIYAKLSSASNNYELIKKEVELVAPVCRWTSGKWDSIDVAWNEIQNTPKDIKKLQEALVRAYTAKILA
jgi:DGQHR domain-containing protein